MKTFTAKQFSRKPGVVFDAARDDGKVEITHGSNKTFELTYLHEEIVSNDHIVIDEEYIKQFGIDMAKAIRAEICKRKEKGPEGPDSEQ